MPMPIITAHKLLRELAVQRRTGKMQYLRPDSKSQVSIRYVDDKPVGIETIVISSQHSPDVSQEQIKADTIEYVIKPTIGDLWSDSIIIHVNPTGRFVVGGPHGDCGLTGRKIIVDTYGGMGRHGGGAFSGKDPSKVDRSAAYACRYVAKNVVAAGLADRCELQVAYAIGVANPVSVYIDTFGTGKVDHAKIEQAVEDNVDLTPKGIMEKLDLRRPIYKASAAYGHFGRSEFPWEKTDIADTLKKACGL
jgi:S-adenosylmethionine synthetase